MICKVAPKTRSQHQIIDEVLAVLQPRWVAFQQTCKRQISEQQQNLQTLQLQLQEQTLTREEMYKQYE